MTLTHTRAVRGAAVTDQARERFTAVFDEFAPRVFAYARRHTAGEDAREIVSEVFLTAWRRFADVPQDDPLPWLLVTARHTIANQRRQLSRRRDTTESAERIEQLARHPVAHLVEDEVVERDSMLAALGELSDLEREAVLLVAWDGLANTAAADVAGCSQRAFEVRLSRARARLSRSMAGPSRTTSVPTD